MHQSRSLWGRRELLSAAGLALVSARAGAQPASAESVPWSSGTERPSLVLPPDAADCHHHIYDSQYPLSATATLRPPNATVDDYRLLQKRLGTRRHVVIQPSTYGTDNTGVVDALAAFGPQARGVAVCDTSVTDDQLQALHKAGIRGLRFISSVPGGIPIEMVEPLSARAEQLGWHVELVVTGDDLIARRDLFSRIRSPIVIDHIGQIPQPAGLNHPGYAQMLRMLDGGRTWVKLSGAYVTSKTGAPRYADVGPVARGLVAHAPDRLVWGSDWPHPTMPIDNKPDDAVLLDLLADWAPDAAVRQKILVANPTALYQFDV